MRLPSDTDEQEQLSIERVQQMREVKRVALRNIDASNLWVAAATERRAMAQSRAEEPKVGHLV